MIIRKWTMFRKRFELILFLLVIVILTSCIQSKKGQGDCCIETIQTNELSDTVSFGEIYQIEIFLPDFDSTNDYKCITGIFDTIHETGSCRLVMNQRRKYIVWNKHITFNSTKSYILLFNADTLGINEYQGIVTYTDSLDIEKTISFNGDYYVVNDINSSNDSNFTISFDTINVPDSCIIFIAPNKDDINRAKSEMGVDDFYTASDDFLYYLYQIRSRLDSLNYKHINTEKKHLILLNNSNQFVVRVDTIEQFWPIVKFNYNEGVKIVEIWDMMDYLRIE